MRTESNMKKSHSQRAEDARTYAAADKSDPFAFARAMAHMKNGICGFNQNGQDAFYSADEQQETRHLEKINDQGQKYLEEYQVPAYRNRVRP